MKKLLKLLLYGTLISGVIVAVYFRIVMSFVSALATSRDGLLISLYHAVSRYFRDADSLNLIFLVLFACVSLLGFVGVDILLARIGRKVKSRWFSEHKVIMHPLLISPVHKGLTVMVLFVLFILACNAVVIGYGVSHSKESVTDIDPSPVLILGTRKWLSSGKGENLYYRYRIAAAMALWHGGKATYFIASGDKTGTSYDETRDIKSDLVSLGVPPEKIMLDTAGYRTLDSMLRIRQMYKTRDLVVVSQPFHVQRALLLATFYGINATGFAAQGSATPGMIVREVFSKPRLIMDLIFFNMQPRVGVGEKGRIQFRESFVVSSDLHVLFLAALVIAFLSTMGLIFKYLD